MRTTLILLAAGSAALATPAFAQVGGVAGQVTGDVTGQVNPGEVASDTAGRVTQPVGDVVGQTDDMVNDTADSANLKLATQDQVRAGANVTDMNGNSIGTVQSVDGDNAVVVSGGKLYNIPLSELYSKADGAAGSLVSKLPKDSLTLHAGADAGADADVR
ncbi:hypothetical protein [Sphingopyxis indica]|uniref:PRC-barrel domain-containing protein n=1 Tax=Sphingopyxis indica TaxID=436663 RepID=A0A239G4M2_9SPHN|nr:hypothetical protein [Sphingopyxis indica]SNS63688.1 hypothetical protein SAMN06295955_1036 [Sphingopyxis indica]